MSSENNLKGKSKGIAKKKLILILIFSFFFMLVITPNAKACWCQSHQEFASMDVMGDIGPQKSLKITLGVYGNGKASNITVYTYSTMANITPNDDTRYVDKYEIILLTFSIFFNYSTDVEYFENNIEFYLYSHYCKKIVDTISYKAVFGEKDVIVNVNNSLVFGFREATILKLIAFGLIGSIGAVFVVNFMKSRDRLDLSKEIEERKKLKTIGRRNIFSGVAILFTLFTQYVTANIFYPYPSAFNFLWGNEVYGLLLAGIVFFFILMFYKKYFIVGSILIVGTLFSFLDNFYFGWLLYATIVSIIATILLRSWGWIATATIQHIKRDSTSRLSQYGNLSPQKMPIYKKSNGRN